MRGPVLCLTVLLSCGPGASGGDASSDVGGSSAGVQDAGSETAGLSCADLAAQAPGQVTLRVRNTTTQPIFLDQQGCAPPVSLTREGTPVRWQFPECNLAACDGLPLGECSIACADCASGVIRVAAGGAYELLWNGTVFEDIVAAAECAAGECAPECHLEVTAPVGVYALKTRVFAECPFEDPTDCECPGGSESTCAIFSSSPITGQAPQNAEADFVLPDETVVELVIGT